MLAEAIESLRGHFPNRLRDLHHFRILHGFSKLIILGSGAVEQLIEVVTVMGVAANQSKQRIVAAGPFPGAGLATTVCGSLILLSLDPIF